MNAMKASNLTRMLDKRCLNHNTLTSDTRLYRHQRAEAEDQRQDPAGKHPPCWKVQTRSNLSLSAYLIQHD